MTLVRYSWHVRCIQPCVQAGSPGWTLISQNSFRGPLGVMALISYWGTLWAISHHIRSSARWATGPFVLCIGLAKDHSGHWRRLWSCLTLLLNAWFLDDGVLAGKKSTILSALLLIGTLGPQLGLQINLSKCELFSHNDTNMFPSGMKVSHVPHCVILGAPIGDYLFCARYIASKHTEAMKLLSGLHGRIVLLCSLGCPNSLADVWRLL